MGDYTVSEIERGELAMRHLSPKALEYYNGCEVTVCEVYNEDGEKRYDIKRGGGWDEKRGMTFEEIDKMFVDYEEDFEHDEFTYALDEFMEEHEDDMPDLVLDGEPYCDGDRWMNNCHDKGHTYTISIGWKCLHDTNGLSYVECMEIKNASVD